MQNKCLFGKGLKKSYYWEIFVCLVRLRSYAVSTVFQLFNEDSSQIHVSLTIFNQFLTQSIILTLAGQS